jgi:hypothetical protein
MKSIRSLYFLACDKGIEMHDYEFLYTFIDIIVNSACPPFHSIYRALVLFEQSNCIAWINICYGH